MTRGIRIVLTLAAAAVLFGLAAVVFGPAQASSTRVMPGYKGVASKGGSAMALRVGAGRGSGQASVRGGATLTPTPVGCGVLPVWQPGPSYAPARQYIQARIGDDGKYYMAGGWIAGPSGTTQTNDAARFNPQTNSWEPLPPMPIALGVYGMAAANNRIYVVGGSDIPTRTLTTTIQVFDIGTNSWSIGPSVPRTSGVQGPAVAVVNNKLYVIGGASNTAVFALNNILDLATNTWTNGAPMPQALFLSGTTVANGLIYVFGGGRSGNIAVDTLYAYNPATDSWTTLAPANTGGLGQVGNISPYAPGMLLATDGTNTTFVTRTNTTHLYEIATDTWSPGPLLNTARYGHAQETLPDGRVMVYGGSVAALGLAPLLGVAEQSSRTAPAFLPPSSGSDLLPPILVCATPTGTPTSIPTATASRTATAVATGTATLTPTPCTISFSDVASTDYFYEPVRYLYCAGAISGYSDNTFRPYNDTTRGQLTKIVVLAEGWPIDTSGGPHFSDVPTNNPFYLYIETAFNRGIISGYADGTFRWGNNVTRGQLCKIIVGAEGWFTNTTLGQTFSDVPPEHPFYVYIEAAYSRSVISGYADGTFRPGNNATRGQISKIVYNAVTQP
jgi:hypothetical protein